MAKTKEGSRPGASAAAAKTQSPRERQMQILLGAILVLAVIATEFPAIHGPFQWDDLSHISLNPTLRAPDALWKTWTSPTSNMQYYPLTITAFWVEFQLFGLQDMAGYHLVNFLLHGVNAVLVWQLLKKLKIPWPYLAALCFAIHPLLVDSVAYISELKNLLSGGLCLIAALCWFYWLDHPRSRWHYVFCLIAFALALLGKSIVCTLPVALLLIEYWRAEGGAGRISRRALLGSLPLFVIALVMGIVFIQMERAHVGASGPEFEFSPMDRVLIAGRAVVFYATKLLLPIDLVAIYPRWAINAGDFTQYLYPLAVVATLVFLFLLRRRLGRGPLVAVGLFILMLAPALGFISFYPMLYSFVADHYCYLAAIPFFALAIAMVHRLVPFITKSARSQAAVAIVLVVLLAPLTLLQAVRWRSESALWEPTVAVNPNSWAARENLAYGYLNENRPEEARRQALAAIALSKDDSRAYYTLGAALFHLGDYAGAIAPLQRGMELEPGNPVGCMNLAMVLDATKNYPQAELVYRHVLEIDPSMARAWNNLAVLLQHRGDWAGAEEAAGRAVAAAPNYGVGRVTYGTILRHVGKFQQAADQLQAGLAMIQENPQVRLEFARALEAAGNAPAALLQYDIILREAPGFAEAEAERAALAAKITGTSP